MLDQLTSTQRRLIGAAIMLGLVLIVILGPGSTPQTARVSADSSIPYIVVKRWPVRRGGGQLVLIDSSYRSLVGLRKLGLQLHQEYPKSRRDVIVQVYADSAAAYRRPGPEGPPLTPDESRRDKASLVGVYTRDADHELGQGRWVYGPKGVEHDPAYIVNYSGESAKEEEIKP